MGATRHIQASSEDTTVEQVAKNSGDHNSDNIGSGPPTDTGASFIDEGTDMQEQPEGAAAESLEAAVWRAIQHRDGAQGDQ